MDLLTNGVPVIVIKNDIALADVNMLVNHHNDGQDSSLKTHLFQKLKSMSSTAEGVILQSCALHARWGR